MGNLSLSNIKKEVQNNVFRLARIYHSAGYSDTLILQSSFAVSILITGAIVGVEISWKLAFGQNLMGTSHTYVYLGMQVVFSKYQTQLANLLKKIFTSCTS